MDHMNEGQLKRMVDGDNNPLSIDALEAVSGGTMMGDVEASGIKFETGGCWFYAKNKAENHNGVMRKRCNQYKCKALIVDDAKWHQCRCWGTNKCVDNWHYAEGCP